MTLKRLVESLELWNSVFRSSINAMVRCTNKGCLKEYDEKENAEESCSYHPGGPVRTPVAT